MVDLTDDLKKKNKLSERQSISDYINYIKYEIENSKVSFLKDAKAVVQVKPETGMHHQHIDYVPYIS